MKLQAANSKLQPPPRWRALARRGRRFKLQTRSLMFRMARAKLADCDTPARVRLKLSVTPWRCRLKAAIPVRPERRLQPAATRVTDGFNRTPPAKQTLRVAIHNLGLGTLCLAHIEPSHEPTH